jgi:ABC-type transporter Mla subunit MlaD
MRVDDDQIEDFLANHATMTADLGDISASLDAISTHLSDILSVLEHLTSHIEKRVK